MRSDYLNEKDYEVNANYPYQEFFRNEQGRIGAILSLMGRETVYHVPNMKLMRYESNVLNCDCRKYCIENNTVIDDNLVRTFDSTIHNPHIVRIWDSMDSQDRLEFQAVIIVDHYPHLADKIYSIRFNNNDDFDNFDDFI